LEPSVASSVHSRLRLPARCLNFDIGNACLGFLNGMQVAAMMIERGQIDYALLVDAESSRQVTESTIARLSSRSSTSQDLRDDFATLTLGSGAAAMLLCRDDFATTEHRFKGGVALTASDWNHLCRGTAERMITDAGQLLRAGVSLAKETFALAGEVLGWRKHNLDELIMHQVGSIHMSTMLDTLDIDPMLAHVTYNEYGNIGPAAIPFTLTKSLEEGRIQRGDRVALMGIGSGLSCAMMEVEW
ncbi:MAG: 3-oxoacyl-ACP synthase III, partial [Myxococcota bacterium]